MRSFRGTWGFLQTDGIDGDIFVGLKGNPHLSSLAPEQVVQFDLITGTNSKPEAVNVQPVAGTAAAAVQAGVDGSSGGSSNGSRHSGWIRSFTGNWGFINSDFFVGDLFVGLRSNPHLSSLAQGDQVDFAIRATNGKNEAVEVLVTAAAPRDNEVGARPQSSPPAAAAVSAKSPGGGDRAEVSHLVGQQLVGTIRSFKEPWGFVNAETFSGDLFVHRRNNPDLATTVTAGCPVSFEVAEDTQQPGSFHAVKVAVLKDELRNLVGKTVGGWVKSFRDKWGLLQSSRFDGDIFVGLGANPHFTQMPQQGAAVEFKVAADGDRFQAVEVVPAGSMMPAMPVGPAVGAAPPAVNMHSLLSTAAGGMASACGAGFRKPPATPRAPSSGAGRPKPEQLLGSSCKGVVKSFRDQWGFINSEHFEGDLFVHARSNPGISLDGGEIVHFQISQESNGKMHATSVQVLPLQLEELCGKMCSGTVRKFSGEWGFITSPRFSGDLFVGTRSNPHLGRPLQQGEQVEFLIQAGSGRGGRSFEAANVKAIGASSTPGSAARAPPAHYAGAPAASAMQQQQSAQQAARRASAADRSRSPVGGGGAGPDALAFVGSRLTGQVRTFRGAWGFITSPQFSGDLFVGAKNNTQLEQSLRPGDQVSFQIVQGAAGKAEAAEVQLL